MTGRMVVDVILAKSGNEDVSVANCVGGASPHKVYTLRAQLNPVL